MTPIQQLMLGAGGKADPIYMDDVFSTFLYKGNSGGGNSNATKTITNGIDLATEGGLVWFKRRTHSSNHYLVDTERGVTKYLNTNDTGLEDTDSDSLTSFNTNGFTLGDDPNVNADTNFASWSFRKTKGFCDVVTWTGNATARTISHNLGSVPGLIMVKCRSDSQDWAIYHKDLLAVNYFLKFTADDAGSNAGVWNHAYPTATEFSIGDNALVNANTETYVAYIFAGGESTAATSKSVDFDGNDYLVVADSSNNDFYFGTGDFTVEGWVFPDTYGEMIGAFHPSSPHSGWLVSTDFDTSGRLGFYQNSGSASTTKVSGRTVPKGQWSHFAVTRSGNTFRMFLNGTLENTWSETAEVGDPNTSIHIGADTNPSPARILDGKLSNIRVVKGTAVYTSSFRPPTEPLTNITNTKLLCCNNSSTTGSTVTPGTITATGDPTASSDSPFDDPAGFVFGDSKEEIIKCGSYVGNGSSTGPEVYIGWEPQFLFWKNASVDSEWKMSDSMRGHPTGGNEETLYPHQNSSTGNEGNVDLTPTGFKVTTSDAAGTNGDGNTIVYLAIRRPDGYVGKPVTTATNVFAIDAPNSNSTGPIMESGFPVDFGFMKEGTSNWWTSARLMEAEVLRTNDTTAETNFGTEFGFDYMDGWVTHSSYKTYHSWMWKRHAGFDVVTDKGNGVTKEIAHGLGVVPQMIWRKNRDGGSDNWQVYHFGLNGGTNPHLYRMYLNTDAAENADNYTWVNAPTATHFTVGSNGASNRNNEDFLTMLFSSVAGISKVGYYTGNGSTTGPTITTGFNPRFLMIKSTASGADWHIVDTTRGFAAGSDKRLALSTTTGENNDDLADPSSTGFQVKSSWSQVNGNGVNHIYYAHA